ncbi:hypothetical protein NUW54_g14018 [Trametes sanguinea]|uniref:Uncharacterized protein n=1 Tax=Trametes sanguinea TaxID=158606 RepID=A0ACC1MGT5_9APHY|nr:hypothetical protein NUW54_g14018 [Trametes sanguinea]
MPTDTYCRLGSALNQDEGEDDVENADRGKLGGVMPRVDAAGRADANRATGRFVWLKDAWRVYYDKLEQEGTVLGMLNAKGIAHVPTLLCHGDIRQQTTQTSDFWEKENARAALKTTELNQPIRSLHPSLLSSSSTLVAPPHFETSSSRKRSRTQVEGESPGSADEDTLRRHMHYRLVINEVALPLSHFSSGRKLVLIVIDCIKAHRDAVEKAEIMHRDVSGGNILIYPHVEQGKTKHRVRWGGFLADWEMSKSTKVEELQSPPPPRQPPRTVCHGSIYYDHAF